MLRSMYSGISGMKNFQTKLDVIGNNIANVNTFGFKKGRVNFKDLMSQQIAGATAPTGTTGGVNPKQVGLGTQLASIDTIDTQGSLQTTGRTLDLALSGDGYFIVGSGTVEKEGTHLVEDENLSYTRAGNFYFDKEGFLVNADGLYVIGLATSKTTSGTSLEDPMADDISIEYADDGTIGTVSGLDTSRFGAIRIPTSAESFSIGADGTVTYVDENGDLRAAGVIGLAKFPNNGGLEKVGENLYKPTSNSGLLDKDGSDSTEVIDMYIPGQHGAAKIAAGTLEMSNVDLSEEFTEMIVAQRGFQANTKIITTSDEILQELVNLKR